jgi:hypothetical protein
VPRADIDSTVNEMPRQKMASRRPPAIAVSGGQQQRGAGARPRQPPKVLLRTSRSRPDLKLR